MASCNKSHIWVEVIVPNQIATNGHFGLKIIYGKSGFTQVIWISHQFTNKFPANSRSSTLTFQFNPLPFWRWVGVTYKGRDEVQINWFVADFSELKTFQIFQQKAEIKSHHCLFNILYFFRHLGAIFSCVTKMTQPNSQGFKIYSPCLPCVEWKKRSGTWRGESQGNLRKPLVTEVWEKVNISIYDITYYITYIT